jgi:type IV pilus assembly protein PilB
MLAALNLDVEKYKDHTFYKGKGCPTCSGTGYKGRVGFYEVMLINDALRDVISKGKTTEEIRKVAKDTADFKSLRDAALDKALKGVTTLEEVLRNTIDV